MPNRRPVYIFSDATGQTAAQTVRVALEQFPGVLVHEHLMPHVRTPAEIAQIVFGAAQSQGIVVFTLVDEFLRKTAHTVAKEQGVIAIDLLEPLLNGFEKWLGTEPRQQPGHPYDPMYFERMKAFDFVTLHDDGKHPEGLHAADVVVLGLSRSGKSPVCRMLAEHRVCAGNVPIVPTAPLSEHIEKLDPRRVYVLRVDAQRLLDVRANRLSHLGAADSGPYTDRDEVKQEGRFLERLIASHAAWTVVNATRMSVEEVASEILKKHRERFPPGE